LSLESRRGASLRAAAARLVARVVNGGQPLPETFEDRAGADPRDPALLRAIVAGTIRWHHRLQWQLDRLLSRPLGAGEAELGALLRVGLFQLEFLRIPDHAAVSATVEASAAIRRRHARGLVNAVLRRYLRDKHRLAAEIAAYPEAEFSHPLWLIEAIQADWPDAATAILRAGNAEPPMWLRVNARRTSRDDYAARLQREGMQTHARAELPQALALSKARPVDELPGYREGDVSVQDGAAQYAAGFLSPQAGDRVLDACAAPGGKAAHLLETHPQIGELVCVDSDAARLEIVRANLSRLGLEARLVHGDATYPDAWWDGRPFDRILLDAPCSALGVIRRHPEIKLLRRPADIDQAARLQRALLDALWPTLAVGGRLLYVTCTVTTAENSRQIVRFMQDTATAGPAEIGGAIDVQRLPGEADMDGFYYACMTKQDAPGRDSV
jgi:16S rRNA (cytosine967-C5)-methyltransferase